jgi:hypothetical protein
MPVDTDDLVAIQRIVNLYGILVDDERWDDLRLVFTEDAVLEVRAVDWVMQGVAEIAAGYGSVVHPLGHHMTNTVIEDGPTRDEATGVTKYITVRADGTTGTGMYRDRFVRTPEGWRISERIATLRGKLPPKTTRA